MLKPRRLDFFRDLISFQRFFENLPAARKVPSHDRMICMRFAERPAACTQYRRRENWQQADTPFP